MNIVPSSSDAHSSKAPTSALDSNGQPVVRLNAQIIKSSDQSETSAMYRDEEGNYYELTPVKPQDLMAAMTGDACHVTVDDVSSDSEGSLSKNSDNFVYRLQNVRICGLVALSAFLNGVFFCRVHLKVRYFLQSVFYN